MHISSLEISKLLTNSCWVFYINQTIFFKPSLSVKLFSHSVQILASIGFFFGTHTEKGPEGLTPSARSKS